MRATKSNARVASSRDLSSGILQQLAKAENIAEGYKGLIQQLELLWRTR